jgi:hypothetical protein
VTLGSSCSVATLPVVSSSDGRINCPTGQGARRWDQSRNPDGYHFPRSFRRGTVVGVVVRARLAVVVGPVWVVPVWAVPVVAGAGC